MEIKDIEKIYNKFEKVGCLTFATVNEHGEPETRIAHLRAWDKEGIYFMTMYTKSLYKQLKESKKISVCGLCAATQVEHDENGFPIFEPGYAIRMTGDVREVSMDDIKSKNNPIFDFCIKDQEKYPAMVIFCITSARGDIFDYDFEMISRENKLERIYFSYNDREIRYSGLTIDKDKCIGCGICNKKCSFKAIDKDENKYRINKYRCDECGDCYINCPVEAIKLKV